MTEKENKWILQDEFTYVFWMNIGIEESWNDETFIPQIKTSPDQKEIIRDTEQLCLFLAKSNDVVILRKNPPQIVKDGLKTLSINNIQILIPSNNTGNISEDILEDGMIITYLRKINENSNNKVKLVPYITTEKEEMISLKTGCELVTPNSALTYKLNSKIIARKIGEKLALPLPYGKICCSVDQLERFLKRNYERNCLKKIVIKEPYGASGKGLFLLEKESDWKQCDLLIKRNKGKQSFREIWVEQWYETKVDLNYQLYIGNDDEYSYIEPKQQINKGTQFKGCQFPVRLTNEEKYELRNYAIKLVTTLNKIGYRGFVSIDSIITHEGIIFPLIEINARLSLSTYLLKILEQRIKNRIYRMVYFDVFYKYNWNKVKNYIYQNLYDTRRKKGIIPCMYSPALSDKCKGRLFVLIVSESETDLDTFQNGISGAGIMDNLNV